MCIAGILRIWYTTYYFSTYDIFYNGAVLSVLAVVECNIGIICGSLPSVRQLIAQIFPRLLDSSVGHTRSGTAHNSQSFPFQNLEAKSAFETSVVGGRNHVDGDNTSQESILREDMVDTIVITRRQDFEVGHVK